MDGGLRDVREGALDARAVARGAPAAAVCLGHSDRAAPHKGRCIDCEAGCSNNSGGSEAGSSSRYIATSTGTSS